MKDEKKTKKQLISELAALRQQVAALEKVETERKQAGEALRESEHEKALILNSVSELVTYQDNELRIMWANRAAVESAGLSPGEMVGRHCYEIWQQRSEPCIGCPVVAALETGEPHEAEMTTPDGEVWSIRGYPVRDENGRVTGAVEASLEITERKRAEEALRKSEERYKKQFEGVMDAILIADAETGIIVDCNRVASELIGREKSELVGKHQRILHPPEEIEGEFSRTFKQHLKEKEGQVLETQAITKKGEIKDVAIKASVFELEGQKMVLGIFRDITERKRMEKALRENEENFRAVAENANEGILVAVGEAAHVYVNKRAAEITGYSVAELLETDMKGLVHPDEFKKIMERYRKRLAGKPVPTHYETIFIRKDGKSVPVEFAAAKTVWQGGPASVVFFRDITERKQAEEALRQSEARFRELFDGAPVGYHELDIKGRITRVNRTELDMLGYTAEEMLGRPVWEFMVEKKTSRQAFAAKLSGAMPPGRAFERTYRRKDGTTFPVLIEDHHLRDESGQIIGLRSTIQDITELKQVEDALRAEKALMDALMDNIPDSIYFKDRQCRLTRINRNMMRSLDLEEMSQALGKTDLDLYGEEFGRKTLVDDQRILTTGKPIIGLIESRRLGDGQINWTSTTKIPLHDASGQIVGLVGVTREINEVKRAEEEAHKRLREITALHRVSEVINSTLDLKEVFQRVVEELSSTFGYQLVGIGLVKGEGLRLQAQIGYDRETAPDFIPLEWGVVGRVARTGQPALIRDVTQDPDYVATHPDITCEICVPVMSGGTTLGTLNVESDDKRPLTDHDLQLLSILSSHIGVAIENARLYEHSKKRVDELSGLYDISQAFSSMTDVRETFGELTKRIAQLIGCQMCFIATYDQQAREMHAEPPGYGLSDELVRSLHYKVDGPARESWNFRLQGPLLANDRAQIPDFFSWWAQYHGLFNLLIVPLSIEGRVTGLAYAANKPGGFAQDDTRLLTMFANQAAIAIQNARLYEQSQGDFANLSRLFEASSHIGSSLDLSDTLQFITQAAVEASDGHSASLILTHPEGGAEIRATVNYAEELKKATEPRAEGVTAKVVQTGEAVIIPNVPEAKESVNPGMIKAGFGAAACLPLRTAATTLGAMWVNWTQPRHFPKRELKLLQTFANQAAIAIENARLYDETQRHLKEMTTLQRIGMEITSSLDPSNLLQGIADSTLELTNADYVHLFALDPDSGEFNQRAASWQPEVQKPPITWPRKNKGLTAAVLKAQEPMVIEKATDSPIYATPELRKWDVKSVAGFPLKGKWGVTGVLNLVFLQPHTFSQDELDLLALLADQAAIAIENARLYEKTQHLAITDGLTGLYNLRYFYETLEKEIKRSERYHRPLSLIILDIDDFKAYNDRHGHLAGDHLLTELAQLMSKVIRTPDTLARYGGEEFTIILPETDTEQAIALARRLQKEVRENRFAIEDGQTIGRITLSLGIATYPHHAHRAKALVDAADKAMLQAKRAGKNQIAVLREALTELEPL